ncbi:hypothetical protein ACQP25_17085 [Microtetraspora malaysiensis]|uniref:hypothetical protein n=1 Tax=Microtetraspora malaysiensis TaxID=161358 RepID=UPI003D8EBDDD
MTATARTRVRRIVVMASAVVSAGFTAVMLIATVVDLSSGSEINWAFWSRFAIPCIALASVSIWALRRETRARLAQVREDPGQNLSRRVERVNTAFAEATSLMDDLRRDLEVQKAARQALLAEAEDQQRLLEVNEEQAEKIRQILIGETKKTIRAERRQQWLFFALGVLVSIPVGVAINLLVP